MLKKEGGVMEEEKRIRKLLRDYQDVDFDDAVYNERIRKFLFEDKEIFSWEEGFMQGYEESDEIWEGAG